jgi:preprotein translocase subunit SecG
MYTILLVIHTIIVVFLILMVLIQRTDGDGLGGLGGGGNQFLTGRSQANLMTRTTAILAGIFMLTSLVLAIIAGRSTTSSIVDNMPLEAAQEAPAKAAEPVKQEQPEAAKKAAPSASVPKPE